MRSRVFSDLSNVVYKVSVKEKNSVRGPFTLTVRQNRRSMVRKTAKKQGFLGVGENKYAQAPTQGFLGGAHRNLRHHQQTLRGRRSGRGVQREGSTPLESGASIYRHG